VAFAVVLDTGRAELVDASNEPAAEALAVVAVADSVDV